MTDSVLNVSMEMDSPPRIRAQLIVISVAAVLTGGLLMAAWLSPGRAELDTTAKVLPMERAAVNLSARGAVVATQYSIDQGTLKVHLDADFDQPNGLTEGKYLVVVSEKLYKGLQEGRRLEAQSFPDAFPQITGPAKVRVYRMERGSCNLVNAETEVEAVTAVEGASRFEPSPSSPTPSSAQATKP